MELFIIIFFIFFYFLIFAFSIAMYLLNGFGLMEMAKRCGEKYPFLGFIPYANTYLIGKIAYSSKKGGLFYLISQIVIIVLVYIIYFAVIIAEAIIGEEVKVLLIIAGVLMFLFMLASLIIVYVTMYRLYRKYSNKYLVMLIFTILTGGMLAPIFTFAIRKNKILRT